MAAAAAQLRSSGSIRPPLLHSGSPSSPRTPNRTFSSSPFSSPIVGGKGEDDPLIFEFGARFFRAGYARDAAPICSLGYGPSEQQRAGDYRYWEPGFVNNTRRRKYNKRWADPYELWPLDLRGVNLGLVEDKVDRAVRLAFSRYLLSDSKQRRILLVLPPAFPHPLLTILLTNLFHNFQCPAISLLSGPVMSVVAAGVRSGLVVDIGWHEAVVTAVFEYREVHCRRSIRGGKRLIHEMAKMLNKEVKKARDGEEVDKRSSSIVSFEEVEDVLIRFGWCRNRQERQQSRQRDSVHASSDPVKSVFLLSTSPSMYLPVSFSAFSEPVETAFFPEVGDHPDDEELPLGSLVWRALVDLPLDVRSICMSRITVVGGVSDMPGLKRRIIDEVADISLEKGWDRERRHDRERNLQMTQIQYPVGDEDGVPTREINTLPEQLRRLELKDNQSVAHHGLRGLESLGPWAGTSLVSGLKVKGIVEVEKDKFLQQGLAGASREVKQSVVPRESTYGSAVTKSSVGDRSSWTLGVWA
ncbi:MAG: rRNA-processing protein sof1 [Watsoniomyces obsoletus]|nr:MAG: rRNA-processing protein sof1 [Watsoniomyces obsoletus]